MKITVQFVRTMVNLQIVFWVNNIVLKTPQLEQIYIHRMNQATSNYHPVFPLRVYPLNPPLQWKVTIIREQ